MSARIWPPGSPIYAVLSLFPALLAVISLLGVFGQGESTTNTMLELVERIGQDDAVDQLRQPITQMTETNAAGFALVFGLAGAVWSASGYVGAFGRAMNKIYEVDEGRPFWKLRPLNLAITVVDGVLAALVLLGLVVTGPFARELGDTLGLGDTTVTVWNIVKWPIMLLVVVFLVAVLYYATPNVKQPKFRWISVGAGLAIAVWIARLGGVRGVRRQLRLLQQDVRVARRGDHPAPVDLADQPGPALRRRGRRRARAVPPTPSGHPGRGLDPAATARHPPLGEGSVQAGGADRAGSPASRTGHDRRRRSRRRTRPIRLTLCPALWMRCRRANTPKRRLATTRPRLDRDVTVAAILLGLGLGGFVDGIVLHQILQWHHMLTDYGSHSSFPTTTLASLEDNTVWDGLFHLSTWVFVTVGVFALWRALGAGSRMTWHSLVGLLLVGWGIFNIVEGIVDHHILTIHHVRDDVASPLWWDIGFLAVGAALILVGLALRRAERTVQTVRGPRPTSPQDAPATSPRR